MGAYLRKPSCLESFFIDLDDCGCNMTFHYYLQLDCKPSLALLDQTLRTMLTGSHKSINLKYQDRSWYLSDYIPAISVIETDSDDVHCQVARRLDCRKQTIGMSAIHTRNDRWFLCFDFFHGAVDGRSGIQFLYDFFAALNGKTAFGSEFSTMDSDLVPVKHKLRGKKLPIPCWPICKLKNEVPTGKGENKTLLLRTLSTTKSLAAKLSSAVGSCFKEQAKMIIPVDVRRYSNTRKSMFGNLIVPIFVDANSNRHIEDLRTEILRYVKDKSLLAAALNSLFFYNKIHPRLRLAVLRRLVPMVMASKKFICCALVSPVGAIDSQRLIAPDFNTTDVIVTFVSFPFTAFSVTSVQFKDHTNTTISWHTGRVSQKVANKLAHAIDENLTT